MTDIYTASLFDITPPNIAEDSNISAVINSIDPALSALSKEAGLPAIIPRIDQLDPDILAHLAWQWHADFFDLAQTPAMMRDSVRSSLIWHMHKGTAYSVISALKAIGIEAEFIPWWKFGGEPYTFRIKANITGDFYRGAGKDKLTRTIIRAVNESKSARSLMTHLDTNIAFREFISPYAGVINAITGNISILNSRPGSPGITELRYASGSLFSGHSLIPLHHNRVIISQSYAANVALADYSYNIGVDLIIMQELLLQFEKRIFQRIDNLEGSINSKIDTQHSELDGKIDSVIEMLRWKGDDESL